MNLSAATTPVGQLEGLLERLIEKQGAISATIRAKLEAMRRLDVDGMLAAARVEQELAAAVGKLDDERRELVGTLASEMRMPSAGGQNVSLRALAARLPQAGGERLLRLAAQLRERMLAVGEANRVVELVCREMMVHFKVLFAAMVRQDGETLTYSPVRMGGEPGRAGGARLLDAVV